MQSIMAQFSFAVTRRSIIAETFFVEADTPDEALEMAWDGNYSDSNIQTEWLDWYDDRFDLDHDFEPEPLCPLHKMVKEYNPTT